MLNSRAPIVILNNEIMPYRVPLFNALEEDPDFQFQVLFCTDRGWDRKWKVSREELTIRNSVLSGFSVRLPKPDYGEKRTVYVNPSLLWQLIRLHPIGIVGYEYSVPAMTALLYSRLAGCAYIVWTEGTGHSERHLTVDQRWARRVIIPRAQSYIGTSAAACANLAALGAAPGRVFEVPQSHAVRRMEDAARRARESRPGSDMPVILYVGFLNERKGVPLLVRAFADVALAHPESRLLLVGDGPLRPRLEAMATELGMESRVEFRGFVQPDEMPAVYASADIFVLPSLEDTFGVVVVEALASGLPVICSTAAGAASHLVDEETALLVDPEDVEQLASRIARLLQDAALRRRLSAGARKAARAFEASSVARPFTDAVRAAVAARRR